MGGALPTGTVTFLFSDIEGSTRLWEEQSEEMSSALERHDAIVRDAIDRHDGHVFATGGDGYGAVFERAERAVAAAVDAQRRLVSERWSDVAPIRVRMGLHSGETRERGGNYFGPTVNRCARIMAAAQPTQILASDVTRGVVSEYGLGEVGFDAAGSVVLRGTVEPVALYSVVAPGLPVIDRPSGSSERAGNVVAPLSSFVGREVELEALAAALEAHRLVTLIGVGGVGKTRLAIEASLAVRGRGDGVWLVELGAIDNADEVAVAVSDAFRLLPTPGVGFERSVSDWCSSRELLLVLDNCEHVLRGAASFVGSLLAAAPKVTVLATSREPLMVRGEHVVPVPSLSLEATEGGSSEAVEFFVERARAEAPAFDVAGHEADIGEICQRLDGIPLALELAAARVRGLSVREISRRLDERFRLLTGGKSASVERHATLRATVDWSYDLLDPAEQELFERLAVFAGRFELDDAVGLAGDEADAFAVIDNLTALVNRSLVMRDDQLLEYRLLETLRAYGRERLTLAGRIDDVRLRHAELMAAKATVSKAQAAGPSEAETRALMLSQMVDYGAAAEWAIGAERPELAVSIATDCLATLWEGEEPGRWLAPLIDQEGAQQPWMSQALMLAAYCAMFHEGDIPRGADLAQRAIELDPSNSFAHSQRCIAGMLAGDVAEVVGHAQRAVATATDGHDRLLGLLVLGNLLVFVGRLDEAADVAVELRDFGTSSGYRSAVATAHHLAGRLLAETNPDAALDEFRAGLEVLEGVDRFATWSDLKRELIPVLMRIDLDEAVCVAAEFLERCEERNDTGHVNNGLAYLVTILHRLGASELAAEAAGHIGTPLLAPSDATQLSDTEAEIRAKLGADYERYRNRGRQRPTRELVASVLAILSEHQPRSPISPLGTSQE